MSNDLKIRELLRQISAVSLVTCTPRYFLSYLSKVSDNELWVIEKYLCLVEMAPVYYYIFREEAEDRFPNYVRPIEFLERERTKPKLNFNKINHMEVRDIANNILIRFNLN